MPLSRRGFSLLEILVSLGLMVLVAGVALRVFLRQHWTGMAQGETAAMQSSLRAGLLFLTSELRELGGTPGDADILAFAPESLTYRAMRGVGLSCSRGPGSILLDAATFAGYRNPQAGRDSILLHAEGRLDTESDDRWVHLPLLAVGGGICGAAPALQLASALDTTLYPASGFAALAPARTFEIMQIRLYQSGGDYWLGARSVSAGETIQPLIGPLAPAGLVLAYRDSMGAPASVAADIRSIGITLRALSTNPVRSGGGFGPASRRSDSLITVVALRNW